MNIQDKKWYRILFSTGGKDAGLLLLRVFFGLMILSHGVAKLANFGAMSAHFPDPIGIGSKLSLVLVAATETGAAVLIILGLLTRLAALPLIFSMAIAAFVAHAPFSISGSELPLLYLAVFIVLLITGAGIYSLDTIFTRSKRTT